MLANAQGPIKMWNDQLDDFIEVYNQIDPALAKIYAAKGIDAFVFTYFDPDTGDVIKEAMIADENGYNKVDDELIAQVRTMVVDHLRNAVKGTARMQTIVNEFARRGTNVEVMYSTNIDDKKVTKKTVIAPKELR